MTIKAQIKPSKDLPASFYLLYDQGVYAGRTTDTKNALHFAQRTKAGKLKVTVRQVTEVAMLDMSIDLLEEQLKKENRQAGQEKRKETLLKKKLEQNRAVNSPVAVSPDHYGAFA